MFGRRQGPRLGRGLARACAALWLPALAAACSASSSGKTDRAAPDLPITLFATTELRGTIEPCGCTSDPLGDLSRIAELVAEARAAGRPTLYVDGGSTLFQHPSIPPHLRTQETMKADLLARALADPLAAAAVGLGPYDLAAGAAAVSPPRQACNLDATAGVAVEEPKIVGAGEVSIGLFGVVSPAALRGRDVGATDPVAASQSAVAELRRRGARIVLGLAHMNRQEAAQLARAVSGIDFLLVGRDAPEPAQLPHAPQKIGSTWLIRPANRGQAVSRLEVTVRGEGPFVDALGKERAAAEMALLSERIERLAANLARWRADPSADRSFVARKERELARLEARRGEMEREPLRVPARGSWFVLTQVLIKKGLPCHRGIEQAKLAYERAAGEANRRAAGAKKAPPARGAGYVGGEECVFCHKEADAFWRRTIHARAWDTLEKLGKQFNYDCIGCHVTGWGEPGGATLGDNDHLRAVQCEVCHGPASLHVDADGKEKPASLVRATPETSCVACHNQEHSDTFSYRPYLRDVTGPGHGEAFHKRLGPGPSGQELRSAALQRAGRAVGAGCRK